jgi:hypothetical protein
MESARVKFRAGISIYCHGNLAEELKVKIIESLNLQDITPGQIDSFHSAAIKSTELSPANPPSARQNF